MLLLPVLLGACATSSDLEATRQQLQTQMSSNAQQASARLSDVEAKLANQRLLDLVNQVGQMQTEMASLRGQNEVLQHQLAETQKRQNDLYADLDLRLGKLEHPQAAASAPQGDAPAAAVAPVDAALSHALDTLRKRDFSNAVGQLKGVMDSYPGSSQSIEANYWLGVAHTMLQQNDAAIDILRRFAGQYPKNAHSADALRLVADNQIALQQKDQARITLRQLIKLYPGTPAAQKAKQRLSTL
ncbi:YbgF trimerization domain-containing protein [Vogesella sp. LIG4]|uniref:YbgF trimerization domain-containing protein n=1 Tax=Vogesella sp. LIG4 TaxID=1192162 RepID=UPI00081FE2DE|nr:YbgF trimerization domain-containing protein [Vogesella sp. LIG4]SCK10584.1 tol-pal system protein YbgF [Vogesella sp. LIG4]